MNFISPRHKLRNYTLVLFMFTFQSLTTHLGTFWNELKTKHANEVNCDFNCVENKAKNEDFGS